MWAAAVVVATPDYPAFLNSDGLLFGSIPVMSERPHLAALRHWRTADNDRPLVLRSRGLTTGGTPYSLARKRFAPIASN
jgi:hypothetical protein